MTDVYVDPRLGQLSGLLYEFDHSLAEGESTQLNAALDLLNVAATIVSSDIHSHIPQRPYSEAIQVVRSNMPESYFKKIARVTESEEIETQLLYRLFPKGEIIGLVDPDIGELEAHVFRLPQEVLVARAVRRFEPILEGSALNALDFAEKALTKREIGRASSGVIDIAVKYPGDNWSYILPRAIHGYVNGIDVENAFGVAARVRQLKDEKSNSIADRLIVKTAERYLELKRKNGASRLAESMHKAFLGQFLIDLKGQAHKIVNGRK